MDRQILPISALPAWALLNNVIFRNVKVEYLSGTKWFGLISENTLRSESAIDLTALVAVPPDVILSAKSVAEYAKLDHYFQQLLESAGGRVKISTFLLKLRRSNFIIVQAGGYYAVSSNANFYWVSTY